VNNVEFNVLSLLFTYHSHLTANVSLELALYKETVG